MLLDVSDKVMLIETFAQLLKHSENEIVEFKEANSYYDTHKLGQYFSAISCEANLREKQFGWLIFGVVDKTHEICGTMYKKGTDERHTDALLQQLKLEISRNTTDAITFMDIFEIFPCIDDHTKRVLMFQIPAAASGIPTGWKNSYYARAGESIVQLPQEKIDRIRKLNRVDWSKQIVKGATIEHLDTEAISTARTNYKHKKNKSYISEDTDLITDEQFLTKLKLILNGQITNACMLLLGKRNNDAMMTFVPEIMWRLLNDDGTVKDYEKFGIPYILVVDKIFGKIRNLTYRYMPNQLTLFPQETTMYDRWMFHELLNNCIAHQDYSIGGRIYVNEFNDKLSFANPGSFLPIDIPTVLDPSYSSPYYNNQLLTIAMSEFNMIDTATSGIRRIYKILRDKYFPMPDYNLSRLNQVIVEVYGKVLDEKYTQILYTNNNLNLNDVYLIDRVQKGLHVDKQAIAHLRKLNVVEGRSNSLYLSAQASRAIDEKEQYIKNKGFDEDYYERLIVDYLKQWGKGKKGDFEKLLFGKLPDSLSDQQKKYKIRNMLSKLRIRGVIATDTENKVRANWVLVKTEKK